MRMSEDEFWGTTPRKFFSLVKQHNRAEGAEEEQKDMDNLEPLTLEELMSWK